MIDYFEFFIYKKTHTCWCRLHDKRDVPPRDVREGGQRHRRRLGLLRLHTGVWKRLSSYACREELTRGVRWMGETCQYEQKSLKTAFLLSFLLGNMYASGTGTGFKFLWIVGHSLNACLTRLLPSQWRRSSVLGLCGQRGGQAPNQPLLVRVALLSALVRLLPLLLVCPLLLSAFPDEWINPNLDFNPWCYSYMCRTLSGGRQADLAYGATVGTLLVSAATVWLWWLVVRNHLSALFVVVH